jgi:hypothetical protein
MKLNSNTVCSRFPHGEALFCCAGVDLVLSRLGLKLAEIQMAPNYSADQPIYRGRPVIESPDGNGGQTPVTLP